MALLVEQLSLGPLGTNCYVVRAGSGADEAVVVDPSGDATELRLLLARMGTSCAAILVTHGHWDHLLGVADLAEGTGAPVYMAEGERELLESAAGSRRRRSGCGRTRPTCSSREASRSRSRGSRSTCCRCPGTRPRTSPTTRTGASSPATSSSRAPSDARTFPAPTGRRCSASIRSLVDAYPPETVVYPGHGPATTLGDELARNPFLAELRAERQR